jgi:hypothetical protein
MSFSDWINIQFFPLHHQFFLSWKRYIVHVKRISVCGWSIESNFRFRLIGQLEVKIWSLALEDKIFDLIFIIYFFKTFKAKKIFFHVYLKKYFPFLTLYTLKPLQLNHLTRVQSLSSHLFLYLLKDPRISAMVKLRQ